jgi:selenocysteine lyase
MIVGLGKAAELVNNNLDVYSRNMCEIRDYLEMKLEKEFDTVNLNFNGRNKKSIRLPNTCNVSFIENKNFKGYEILRKTKLLEASTGAWYV